MNETVDPEQVEIARPAPTPTTSPAPQSPKPRRLGRLVLALALAAAVVVGWQYLEKPGPADDQGAQRQAPPAQTVRAAAAFNGDMPVTIDALGAVTPFATVTVKTQIAGRIMEVGFQEGQMVKAGDFLVQIDARPYEAALALAQAQLAKDTALYQQAQADLERYQTLSKQDSIARQQVDDQVFLVAQDKAAMGSDQANIDTAKLNIGYCHIVSPVNGRVGLRLVDAGNYVQPSDTSGIAVVTQIDPISVIFSTPEDNLPAITARLNDGASLAATVFDRSNVKQIATGALTNIDNQVDVATGTFKLRATFANANGALFPQQFVNVRLLVDTIKGAVLAPNAAIQLGAKGSFVYVVNEDSSVSVRQVTTGPSDAQNTVVATGLAVGENVVIDGVDRLRDGAKVSVRNGANGAAQNSGAGGDAAKGEHRRRRDGQGAGADSQAPGHNGQGSAAAPANGAP